MPHMLRDLTLVVPSTNKLIVSIATAGMVVTGAIALLTTHLGPTCLLDMADSYFTSITPIRYMFGLWAFVYTRMVMLIVLNLVTQETVFDTTSGTLHVINCAMHTVWIVAWTHQYKGIIVVSAIGSVLMSVCTIVSVQSTRTEYTAVEGTRPRHVWGFDMSFVIARTITLNAWHAWITFIAIVSVAATKQTEFPIPYTESNTIVHATHAVFTINTILACIITLTCYKDHIYAVLVYTWIIIGLGLRDPGTMATASPFYVAINAFAVVCTTFATMFKTCLTRK